MTFSPRLVLFRSLTLFLIAVLCTVSTVTAQSQTFNIVDFGAVGDGETLNTAVIQKAFDACLEAGGGTVYVPGGVFMSGTVKMGSNTTLKLAENAVLLGSPDIADYRGEGEDRDGLLVADSASNIAIEGHGTFDGNGYNFWDENWKPLDRPHRFIHLTDCEDVTVRDIHIRNSPALTLYLRGVNRAVIDNVTIINPLQSPNTDGIDPSGSRNIRISNCFIEAGDDNICLKSSFTKQATEDITITNCILSSDDSAIKLGTGSHVAIRRVTVSNCVIRNTRYGISFFMKDGGVYEHLLFENLIIQSGGRDSHYYPIFMDIETRRGAPLGKIRDVYFRDIEILSDGHSVMAGAPGHPIENLVLEGITQRITSPQPTEKLNKPRGAKELGGTPTPADFTKIPAHFSFGHIDGLTVRGLNVIVEEGQSERHLLYGYGIHGGILEGVNETSAPGGFGELSALHLEQSRDVVVRGSTGAVGRKTFLELSGENTSGMVLMGNILGGVDKAVKFEAGASKRSLTKSGNLFK